MQEYFCQRIIVNRIIQLRFATPPVNTEMYDRMGMRCYLREYGGMAQEMSVMCWFFLLLMYNEMFEESPGKFGLGSHAFHGLHKKSLG